MQDHLTLTVGANGCLKGGSEILLKQLKADLTISNPKYQDAQKYGRYPGKNLKPYLYFYQQTEESISFPRGYANQVVLLCRKIMRQEAVIIDQRQLLPPVAFSFLGKLRPYQVEAVDAVVKHDFGVLEASTGSGKTVIALAVIEKRQQPTLVLVHSKELLYQWAEKVRTFMGIEAGLVGDGHYHPKPVTIAIVNSARKHLSELLLHFGQICVDECHRVPAALFTDVVTAFNCHYAMGLSATAFRRDGLTRLIYFYLGDRIHQVDTVKLQQSGAILVPEFIQRVTKFRYLYRGNYQAMLQALTGNHERNQLIVNDIIREIAKVVGIILVVSDRVKHCEELARLLADQDINLAVLTGRLAAGERLRLVDDIRHARIKVLISTLQLIGEGFDCPNLQILFLTTPIKFSGRLLQVVGRILRPATGKQPKVYDYVDPVNVLKRSAEARRLLYQNS